MTFLSNFFEIISIKDAYDQLVKGIKDSGQIVVTFDDGYQDVYKNVFPFMKAKGFPFTIFVSTELISSDYKTYCNWNQIIEMSENPIVTIGSHGKHHIDLTSLNYGEEKNELLKSKEDLESKLKLSVEFFAYPLGSTNEKICIEAAENYKLAFIDNNYIYKEDRFRIPRVSINSDQENLKAFIQLLNYSIFINHQCSPSAES